MSQCIQNSITLAAGEGFVLPPGAVIIGSSDINALESTCLDLTTLEQLEYYVLVVPMYERPNDGVGTFFETKTSTTDPRQFVSGYSLNSVDVFYPTRGIFGDGYYGSPSGNNTSFTNIPALNQLQSNIGGVFAGNGYFTNDGSGSNWIYIWQIKTLPSIGDNLEIIFGVTGESFLEDPNNGNNDTPFPYRVKFQKRASIQSSIPLPPTF